MDAIKVILERTPPELAADIIKDGVYFTGGTSQINNLEKFIKEETNLDVDLNMDFVSKIKYKPSDLIIKDVYFYLATPKDNNAVAQDLHDQEVKDFEWCDYNEALFKITYDLDRDVIKKAHRYIKKHNLVLK